MVMFTRVAGFVKNKNFRKQLLGVVALLFVFILGVQVGQGKIGFSGRTHNANQTGLPATIDYSTVDALYNTIRQNYNGTLTETQVLDGLKHGLAGSAGDPYTEYFTAKEAQNFSSELQHTFSGVGAELSQDAEGNIVVVAPLDGSPAAAAGVRAKDVIVAIDGKSTNGMTASQAVLKIRGKKGTKVTLGIVRNKTQSLSITITRSDIHAPTASSKILDGNIGYLQVSQFSEGTMELVDKAVASFQAAGVKKVVLDLRDDTGGEVGTAIDLSSLWLPKNALVMQQRQGTKVVEEYRATGKNPLQGMQTVVLVNAGTASASEIVTLALRDSKAATVIGEQTYGKGVMQELIPLEDGGQLKVTIAKWYPPGGKSIDKKGITPDKVVKMTEEDYKNNTDPQLDAATTFLQAK